MGFDQDSRRRVYELRFKPYPGLLVKCRKPGFAALEKLTDSVLDLGDDLSGHGLAGHRKIKLWRKVFRAFADSLVSWDLTDHGYEVPATRQGVLAQDHEFLLALARTWYVVVVTGSVAETSSDGEKVTEQTDSTSESDNARAEREAILASLPVTVDEPEQAAA